MPEILVFIAEDKKIESHRGGESRLFRDADRSELNVFRAQKTQQAVTTPFQLPMSWNTGQYTRNTH
jgi:hypothetical protein